MKITVHVRGIRGSDFIEVGETAEVMFGAILEVNGRVIDRVEKIETKFNEGFATLTATFIPGEIEVLNHTRESWEELCKVADVRHQDAVRRADGRVIARSPE